MTIFSNPLLLLGIGDFIVLHSRAIKAACPILTELVKSNCSNWKYAPSHNVSIIGAFNPIAPRVIISTSTRLSACDSLVLDLTGSSGSGGRRWVERLFRIDSKAPNRTSLEYYLNTNYVFNPPLEVPSRFLDKGFVYTITVTLCNFFRICSQSSVDVVILNTISPTVYFPFTDRIYLPFLQLHSLLNAMVRSLLSIWSIRGYLKVQTNVVYSRRPFPGIHQNLFSLHTHFQLKPHMPYQ